MKKIVLFLLLMFPLFVKADSLKVVEHYIDSEVEIAGALNVKELIIVKGSGEYFTRNLNYYSFGDVHWKNGDDINLNNGIIYNGQGIEIRKIGAYEFTDEVKFGAFDANVKDYIKELDIENPSDNSYVLTDKENGIANLKIFYPIKNKTIAFYINYIVTNVVVKHNDVKEINYTFKNLFKSANNTYLRVVNPYPTDSELYNVWVHGNQSGEVNELTNDSDLKVGIIAKFPKVEDSINIRMTFPQEHIGIDVYLNKTNIDALEEIKKIEDEKAKNTSRGKRVIKITKYAILGLSIIYALLSVIFLKIDYKLLFIIYLVFGLLIMGSNYLFKFNYWYIYLVILFPLIFRVIKKYIVK